MANLVTQTKTRKESVKLFLLVQASTPWNNVYIIIYHTVNYLSIMDCDGIFQKLVNANFSVEVAKTMKGKLYFVCCACTSLESLQNE